MSAQELIAKETLRPETVASDLLGVIQDIDKAIVDSSTHIQSIEGRGIFKTVFSSSKDDLVGISKSQNKINDLMLGLIQEVIKLNVMSYAFLTAVIGELEQRTSKGWTDSEGKFQTLSETGQTFAAKARDIFLAIAEGSKNTQERIKLNEADIEEIKLSISAKADIVAQQGSSISQLQDAIGRKAQRLDSIDSLLDEKGILDSKQSEAIHMLVEELRKNDQSDQKRDEIIGGIERDILIIYGKLSQLESMSGNYYRRILMGLSVLTISVIGLSIAVTLNLVGFF